MAEPTVSTGFVVYAVSNVAGVTVATVLGIDVYTVFWAIAGGFFGVSSGPKTGKLMAVVRCVFASMLSALFATAAAKYFSITEPLYTWTIACGFSFGFYPITATFVERVPYIIREGLRRALGVGLDDDKRKGDKP